MVRGTVSGFTPRYEQIPTGRMMQTVTIWDFRLERLAPDGTPLPRVAVEMRGTSMSGNIANGDVVEVDSDAPPGQLLRVSAVRNVTSGAVVSARGGRQSRVEKGCGILMLVVVLLFIGGIALSIALSVWRSDF